MALSPAPPLIGSPRQILQRFAAGGRVHLTFCRHRQVLSAASPRGAPAQHSHRRDFWTKHWPGPAVAERPDHKAQTRSQVGHPRLCLGTLRLAARRRRMHLGGIADHMVDQIERRASVRGSNGCRSNQWLVARHSWRTSRDQRLCHEHSCTACCGPIATSCITNFGTRANIF